MILTGKVLGAMDRLEQAEPQAFHSKITTRIKNYLLGAGIPELEPESVEHVQNLAARLEDSHPRLKPQVDEFRAALSEASSAFARVEKDRTSTRRVRPVGDVDLPFNAGSARALIDSMDYK